MKVRTAALVAALAVHQPAISQEAPEALLIEPPKAWGDWKQIFDQRYPSGGQLTGWIPSDQDKSTWKEAISIYTSATRAPGDVTTEVIRDTMKQSDAACLRMNIVRPNPRVEGRFTTAYGQVYCAQRRDAKTGRLEFIKAIASERKVYVVIAMKNVKPFEIKVAGAFNFADDETDAIVDWLKQTSNYLATSVRVCVGPAEKREACSP